MFLNYIVPRDFKKVLDGYSASGYRVIALAYRSLANIPLATVLSMQRYTNYKTRSKMGFQQISRKDHTSIQESCILRYLLFYRDELECDLTFIGLLVFENRLKKQTKSTISELNRAKLRLIMITGSLYIIDFL